MGKKAGVLISIIILLLSTLYSTTFTNTGANIDNMSVGSVFWGDYNNDGFIDLCMSGSINASSTNIETSIYENQNSFFDEVDLSLTGVSFSVNKWDDYDNDSDLDLFVCGFNEMNPEYSAFSALYINTSGTFDNSLFDFVDFQGAMTWIDHDNDGDSDLICSGTDNESNGINYLYQNNGDNFTTDTVVPLASRSLLLQSCDFNNDGLMDYINVGYDSLGTYNSFICLNGSDGFIEYSSEIVSLMNSALSLGDYDNDGDQDLAILGRNISDDIFLKLYQNDDGIFSDSMYPFGLDLWGGDLDWGDFDNDGDLDLLVTGNEIVNSGAQRVSRVFTNINGAFVEEDYGIYNLWASSSAWCDYDNDGDLDLAINGRGANSTPISRLYRNDDTTPNNIPTSPTNLRISEEGEYFKFEWDMATDIEQPDVSLTYEVRIGSTPEGCEVVSPMALPDGTALKPAFGRINSNCFYLIKSSVFEENQTYFWSCQAIDNSFARSPFATEQAFTYQSVGNAEFYTETVPLLKIKSIYPNPANLDSPIKMELEGNLSLPVTIAVYNVRGQLVSELMQNERVTDSRLISWDGNNSIGEAVSNGIYFMKVVSGNEVRSRKVLVIK